MKTDWPKRGEKCGIYTIENMIDGKIYVGQAQCMRVRWDVHMSMLNRGVASTKLMRAWRKHGQENFRFFIVEECAVELLNEREQAWIDTFDAVKTGYNISATAGSSRGVVHGMKARMNMAKGQRKAYLKPGVKERRAASIKEAWATPESKARKSAASKIARNAPEAIVRTSRQAKAQWADPAHRERVAVTQRAAWTGDAGTLRREKHTLLMKAMWTPEKVAARSAAVSATKRLRSPLTVEKVAQIRARYAFRCPINGGVALAKEFGVSRSLISNILLRKIWI